MLSYFALIQLSDDLNIMIGFCINLVIYIHVAINIIIILVTTITGLYLKVKKWIYKRGLDKKLKQCSKKHHVKRPKSKENIRNVDRVATLSRTKT